MSKTKAAEQLADANKVEPTMEEILSSIRKIISEDDKQPNAAADSSEGAVVADEESEAETIDGAVGNQEREVAQPGGEDVKEEDILELTELAEELSEQEAEAEPEVTVVEDDEEDRSPRDDGDDDLMIRDIIEHDEPATPLISASDDTPEPIMSPLVDATATAAFGKLSSAILVHTGGARTLEEMVEDMLRPMLKQWLDENLPSVVERLVQHEIDRVAQRGR